jgi:hypothetical protein
MTIIVHDSMIGFKMCFSLKQYMPGKQKNMGQKHIKNSKKTWRQQQWLPVEK